MKIFFLLLLTFVSFSISIFAQPEVETLLKNSEEFSIKNKLPEAIAEMSKAIDLKPNDAFLYLRRADLNFGLPDYKSVVRDAQKAIELKPDDKQIVLSAARFLRNVRECGEASKVVNDYIAKHKETDDAIYARAHSKMCLGEWIGAYEDMSRAVELAPNNSHYRTTQIALLSKIGYNDLSADQFEQFLTTLKNNYSKADAKTGREGIGRQISEVYRVRAGTHHAKNDEKSEFADLAEFINYYQKDFSYQQRAKIYFDHQMFGKAIEDYSNAIELSPKFAFFRLERADVYVYAGKHEEAMNDYAEALKLDETLADIIAAKRKWAIAKLKKK